MQENHEELLGLYALGALSDEERVAVEREILPEAEARQVLREIQATVQALSYVAQPAAPSAETRQALMQRVREQLAETRSMGPASKAIGRARPRGWPASLGRLGPVAAGASLVLASVSLALLLGVRSELADLQAQNAELASQLADYEQALRFIGQPGLITVEMAGTEVGAGAQGFFYTAAGSQTGFLLVSGLAPLEPGSTYQAWLIQGELPIPAGLFQVTAEGVGTLTLHAEQELERFDTVAVSVEPAAGSLLPSGAVVLLGAISG